MCECLKKMIKIDRLACYKLNDDFGYKIREVEWIVIND